MLHDNTMNQALQTLIDGLNSRRHEAGLQPIQPAATNQVNVVDAEAEGRARQVLYIFSCLSELKAKCEKQDRAIRMLAGVLSAQGLELDEGASDTFEILNGIK